MNEPSTTGLRKFPVAVLISGGGTTLRNLIEKIAIGILQVEIRLVIASRADAKGIAFAERAGIPVQIVAWKSSQEEATFGEAVFSACRQAEVQLVVMAGFLKHLPIPPDFTNRVINIHPGLIPAFCGKGFYGSHVHQAVIDYGAKISGCTVHFVDDEYDHGPIILQRSVPVFNEDTAESLARRVFEQECLALPEAIQLIADGKVHVTERRVQIHAG